MKTWTVLYSLGLPIRYAGEFEVHAEDIRGAVDAACAEAARNSVVVYSIATDESYED